MSTIKNLREDQGMTQIELAAKAGISTSTLSLIENNGTDTANKSTLLAIAMALKTTINNLKGE